jgi:peptidoglycan hydrolase CwlO-like protein
MIVGFSTARRSLRVVKPGTGTLTRLVLCAALAAGVSASLGYGGVSRPIVDRYRHNFENKALFLKLPIYVERQTIFIVGTSARPEAAPAGTPPRFKVGEQVRILSVDFGGDEIRFKLGGVAGATALSTLVFKFDAELQDSFPNSKVFDGALDSVFTEGLTFSELDEAKRAYVDEQFDRVTRDLASTSGTTREFVLKAMTAKLPAYQDALRDVENLKGRSSELASQLNQAQSERSRLETESRQHQAELARLRQQNAALQEKIDSSSSQLTQLGDEIKSTRGQAQTYQQQLATVQRSLNLKVDESRNLAGQIADLGQAARKLQKDNEGLETQIGGLRSSLETERAAARKLAGELDDAKNSNKQMHDTISALTSKEDSLARQYLQLKQNKENLESVTRAVASLGTRVVEERAEAGTRVRRIQVYLKDVPVGSIEWQLPERLSPDESRSGEVRFATESIDYVKLAPEERQVLRSLGERLKLQVKLISNVPSLEVKPERSEGVQEVGERDHATWRYSLANRGTQDGRLDLAVSLVNRNNDEVPLLREQPLVLSTSVVRQFRGYLQPIPLAAGAVLGFLFFAIVGVFRKSRRAGPVSRGTGAAAPYVEQKQL